MVEIKKLRTNYELRFPFNVPLQNFIKSLPKDQQTTKVDVVKLDDGSTKEDWYRVVNNAALSKIIDYIKTNNLKFKFNNLSSEEIEVIKNEYLERKKRSEEAPLKKDLNLNVDDMDFSFMKIQPYNYQKQAVAFFEATSGVALLGDSPGVGKSLSLISYATKNKLKTLIVCPASLKLNWRNEINKFTNEKSFIYKYKPKKTSKEVIYTKEESLFHIINYESLETYIKFNTKHKCSLFNCGWEEINTKKKIKICPKCKAINTIKSRADSLDFTKDKDGIELNVSEYDLISLDEAHYIKNQSAGRTKIVKKAFQNCPKKILLTGTAIKNKPFEFFSLLNFIDPKEWKNAHSFGVRYCDGHETNFGFDYSGASNLEELYQRISSYFLRRTKSEVLPFLPPKTFTQIPIELNPDQYREYKKIEEEVVEESKQEDNDASHLARIQKLKQYTSKIKCEHAIEFIQDIVDGDEKIVVFTEYIATAEKIGQRFGRNAVVFTGQKSIQEKQEAVEKFMNDPKTKVFVGTIGAAGVGITLTVASMSIFVDQPYTPADREQAEDRIHRATSTADKIQIIRLYCQDTLDVDILELLEMKEKITSKVLDGKEIKNRVERLEGSIFRELVSLILQKRKNK